MRRITTAITSLLNRTEISHRRKILPILLRGMYLWQHVTQSDGYSQTVPESGANQVLDNTWCFQLFSGRCHFLSFSKKKKSASLIFFYEKIVTRKPTLQENLFHQQRLDRLLSILSVALLEALFQIVVVTTELTT